MSTASLTPRVFAASLVAALAASAVVPSASLAQEPSDGLRAVPSALLTIDQNRSTVVERIVTEWGRDLAASSAGISIEQLRSMLHGMRADYLLAATVSGSLEGLRSVIAGSLIGTAPVKREATKALGDAERDVVYTPVTPCRVLDTRYGTVPPYNNVPMVGGTVLPVAVNLGSYVTQGGSATDCNLPTGVRAVAVNIAALNPNYSAFLSAGNSSDFATLTQSVVMNFVGGHGMANNPVVPVDGTGKFYMAMPPQLSTHVTVGVLGYFAAPVATPVQCNDVVGPITPIPASSDTVVVLPACAAGFTRTGAKCSGTANVPAGYLVEVNSTGCVFRNLSAAAPYSATAVSTCCQVPGR
jgi:hypothetical protein